MQSDVQQRCNDAFAVGPSRFPLFAFRSHRQVLEALQNGIRHGRRLLCLTGPPGSGKSAVLTALYDSLPPGYVGLVTQPGLGNVWAGLRGQLTLADDTCKPVSQDNLLATLLEAQTHGLPIVQLIDNADKLRPQDFVQLNRFFDRCNGQIVLAGSEDLHALFPGTDDATGRERSGQVFTLQPLSDAETPGYVAHRLTHAGFDPELFMPDALAAVARYSGGTPLLINMLCFVALAESCSAGMHRVTASDIDAVARQRWESGIYPFRVPPTTTEGQRDAAAQTAPAASQRGDFSADYPGTDGAGSRIRDTGQPATGQVATAPPGAGDGSRTMPHPVDDASMFPPPPAADDGSAATERNEPFMFDPIPTPRDQREAQGTPATPAVTAQTRAASATGHAGVLTTKPLPRSPRPEAPDTATTAQPPTKRRWRPVAAVATLVIAGAAVVILGSLEGPGGRIDQLRGVFAEKLYQLAALIDDRAPTATADTSADEQATTREHTTVDHASRLSADTDIARTLPAPAAGPRPAPPDPQVLSSGADDARAAAAPVASADTNSLSPQTDVSPADTDTRPAAAMAQRSTLAERQVAAPRQPEGPTAQPPGGERRTAAADTAEPVLSPAQREHIAELYRKRAEYEMDKGEYAHALTSIEYGLKSEPGHARLKHLRMVVLNELGKPARRR